MVKTQEFGATIGEAYTTVRNVYGRPGREPRRPGPGGVDFQKGSHRRFVAADAIAWRITRDLTALGIDWDVAADLVRREQVADRGMLLDNIGKIFFAVWDAGAPVAAPGFAGWLGSPAEIAEIVSLDAERHGAPVSVRMVSLANSFATAISIAAEAGYAFEHGEIVPLNPTEA